MWWSDVYLNDKLMVRGMDYEEDLVAKLFNHTFCKLDLGYPRSTATWIQFNKRWKDVLADPGVDVRIEK